MDGEDEIYKRNAKRDSEAINSNARRSIKPIFEKNINQFQIFDELNSINVDVFYMELLHEILANVGLENNKDVNEQLLYLRNAFEFEHEKHDDLLLKAKNINTKKSLLGVEIEKATNLPLNKGNKINPFVAVCFESNKTATCETSAKFGSRDPIWGELLFLSLTDKSKDTLSLKIWNFNTEKTGMKQCLQTSNAKSTEKLRLRKNGVISKISQKNSLIGSIEIPVKNLFGSEDSKGYAIVNKNKNLSESKLYVSIRITNEIDTDVTMQEYQYLLRVIVIDQLESSNISHYLWDEHYSKSAEAILKMFIKRINLDAKNLNLSKWVVFSIIHSNYPLSFALFRKILNNIAGLTDINLLNGRESVCFWTGLIKILPSCFDVIRNMKKEQNEDNNNVKFLSDVLPLLGVISKLNVPEAFELFPSSQYSWIGKIDKYNPDVIKIVALKAVENAAFWWCQGIIKIKLNNKANESEEQQIQLIIEIIQLCQSDLRNAIDYYDGYFNKMVNLHYSKIIHAVYKNEISKSIKPIVKNIIQKLQSYEWRLQDASFYYVKFSNVRKRSYKGEDSKSEVKKDTLLRLYATLQGFFGGEQSNNNEDIKYHRWFLKEIPRWLDMLIYKTMDGIEKAISLDNLESNYECVNYSCSAVDTLTLLYEVKHFWLQLAWPDVEDAYLFIIKLIEDVFRCCCFYADLMTKKMTILDSNVASDDIENHRVIEKWCFPINNLGFIMNRFHNFIEEFKAKEQLEQLGEIKNSNTMKCCNEKFQKTIDKTIDTLNGKLLELLNHLVTQMITYINYKINNENTVTNSWTTGSVKLYLESTFELLSKKLDEKVIEEVAEVLSSRLENVFSDLHRKFEKVSDKKICNDFKNCHTRLQEVNQFYCYIDKTDCNKGLLDLEAKFRLFGLETSDLIYNFYGNVLQKQISDSLHGKSNASYGELSVKAYIRNSQIQIEILNARNLQSSDFNGKVNSHIEIKLYPKTISNTKEKLKTKICQNTIHPLYQNIFEIDLIAEEQNRQDGLIVFHLKWDNYFGYKAKYIAFAILPISQINSDCEDFSALQQTHLSFHKPSADDADFINSLKYRSNDNEARKMKRVLSKT